jgi:hypothetical protein
VSDAAATVYALPPALITRADLARLVREVEALDNELEAQKARGRATGEKGYHLPATSQNLNDFVQLNKLDLANDQARMHFKEQLKAVKDKAPVVHMTFAVEADPASLQYLAGYIREQFHPQAVLSVGLQPALVGGVYMRTPNHVHDFSVRSQLTKSRGVIEQDIDQLLHTIPVADMPAEAGAPMGETVAVGAVSAQVVAESAEAPRGAA